MRHTDDARPATGRPMALLGGRRRSVAAAAIAAALVPVLGVGVSRAASTGGSTTTTYQVTLTDTTYAQGFSFPVAATHSPSFHMVQYGHDVSSQAAAIAQLGNPKPMFDLLESNKASGAVTDDYVNPYPVTAAGEPSPTWAAGMPYFSGSDLGPSPSATTLHPTIRFTIHGVQGDRFSLLMMMMCTNDGLAGLGSVALPKTGSVIYPVYAYDAGVEANTWSSADIVDPCGLLAPAGPDGQSQVPTNDGNLNSAPSGTATTGGSGAPLAEQKPLWMASGEVPASSSACPSATGKCDIPPAFGWESSGQPFVPVGYATISVAS